MKMRQVRDLETVPVSLRRAWLHQPRLQAHVRVAHLAVELGLGDEGGDGVDDQHVDRAGAHQRLRRSPAPARRSPAGRPAGCRYPRRASWRRPGSSACSASTNAARPPAFCASAMICSVMVVLPEDSGPKISITRPRGTPPTPSAASKEIEPVEMTAIGTIASFDPRRMIEPLPNCFSRDARAASIALLRSSATAVFSSVEGSRGILAPKWDWAKKKRNNFVGGILWMM